MRDRADIIIIITFFMLALVLNQAVHHNYALPIHADEYDHLAVISEMGRTSNTVWYDPYIVKQRSAARNLELNYDIFLLVYYQITGIGLVYVPLVIPVVFTFLMSLSAFVLAKHLARDRIAGLFAGLFVLFLHNNIALLGYWILVPMAMGLATIPVIAYLFMKGLKEWGYAIMLGIVITNMALTHAVYVVIFLPAMAAYLLLTPQELRRNWLKIVLGILLLFAISNRFVKWDFSNLALTFGGIRDFLVWPYGQNMPLYPLLPYLTPAAIFLASAGILYILLPYLKTAARSLPKLFIYRNSGEELAQHAKFMVLLIVSLFAIRVYADSTGICLLGPCRRTTPALAVLAFAMAGIGVYMLLRGYERLLSLNQQKRIGVAFVLAVVITVAFFVHQLAAEPFTHYDMFYRTIEQGEASALKWVGQNTDGKAVIFASPWVSKAVYVISGRKVVETGAARLGENLGVLQDIVAFQSAACSGKKETLDKYKPAMVYGGEAFMDCNFMDLLYNQGGDYFVYRQN